MAAIGKMDFRAAVDYVLSFADYERLSRSAVVFDLARVEALLARAGNPHLAAKSVHVAGTKGKGSTSAMIASVLTASGYRTGLYTSPHLHTIRERIKVGGTPISEGGFAALVAELRPHVEAINSQSSPEELTTFEVLTALAFSLFQKEGLDFQVMETGLGGRLDATNVVLPQVCVLTSISLDHTEVLGDTIAQIAAEKAGIIKPGTTVVCAPQDSEALEVVQEACRKRGASLVMVGRDITWGKLAGSDSGQSFDLHGTKGAYRLTIPLLGDHQLENAAVAAGALEVLADQGISIPFESMAAGLAHVDWPGRLQVLHRNPLVVVDGAHNAYSVRKLKEALQGCFDFDAAILIVGASRDKNVSGIVAELAQTSASFIVTQSAHPRAADTAALATEFSRWGVEVSVAPDTASAITLALSRAKPTDIVCVTGSLFVVSEAIEQFPEASIEG
jgi:dihydrofolate synthase/folylpolyglutamate synthase